MSPLDALSPLAALHEARALLAGVEHDGAREVVRVIDQALASFPEEEAPTGMRRRPAQAEDHGGVELEALDVVAHDLKDPLSAILMGSAYLLKALPDDEASARARKMATAIHRSAERMSRLVKNLLEVARIERGRLALAKAPHELVEIIERAASKIEPLAAEKGVTLAVSVQGGGTRLVVDVDRATDAIVHLASNAVRFTPPGKRVSLTARAERAEVVVEVADEGPGIDGERLAHLFDRYYHMRQRPREGTGLGLAVAHGVIEAHGGSTRLVSTGAQGSTFAITLPI
jgi:signal transduction histidine kinase